MGASYLGDDGRVIFKSVSIDMLGAAMVKIATVSRTCGTVCCVSQLIAAIDVF
jgi:hypothetical protein